MQSEIGPATTYDVIIAGAGPAGCVLANRLSAQAGKTVLLMEAGPDAPPGSEHTDILDCFPLSSDNPAFHWRGLRVDWDEDHRDCSARLARSYTKGYGVGGGSNINGMAADRGLPDDYNLWAREFCLESWSWDDVLPYFRKLERDLDFAEIRGQVVHGDSGPMPVRRLPRSRWAPFTAAIANVLEHRGFAWIEDYAAQFEEGFAGVPTNSLPEGRVSASMAYLTQQVRRRPNLSILANAHVDRVHLTGRHADGVFVKAGGTTTLVRGREIILSCGAIHSPAVLMRSGIGPGTHLERHGISVTRDLPGVGANLHNHPCVLLTTYLSRNALQPADNPWFLQNWLRFSSNHPGCGRNDMHLMQFNKTAWHALGDRVGAIAVTVLQSFSRGSVELASLDPTISPKVRFNMLADERDYRRLVAGLRFTLQVLIDPQVEALRHDVFLPYGPIVANLARRNGWNASKAKLIAWILDRALLRKVVFAGSKLDARSLLKDESALRDFVRLHSHPQAHDCGTCRMGRADDTGAVVNGTGKIHGVEGLRVVDASIFPTIPRGYPHFIVIMSAEKIADAIIANWRASTTCSSTAVQAQELTGAA